MAMTKAAPAEADWYALSVDDVVARVGVDAERGLDPDEVQRRLAEFGRNEIASEPPPTLWEVAKGQLMNPMNIMLLIVSIASLAIGQVATGVIVMALVSFNVIMGRTRSARRWPASRRSPSSRSPAQHFSERRLIAARHWLTVSRRHRGLQQRSSTGQ
jgi:magnesium-transporting ATPase (P-type)